MTRLILKRAGAPLATILAAVALTSCGGSSSTTAGQGASSKLALPASQVQFGEYQPVPLVGPDAPSYRGPATPHSLQEVRIASYVQSELAQAPGAAALLAKNGFVVVPANKNPYGLSLFSHAYQGNYDGGWPIFLTTDAAYNAWHLAFDKILRDLEQEVLLPKLVQLVDGLLTAARTQAKNDAGSMLADDASRVEQLFEVAAAELGQRVTLGPLAQQEKALIDAHDQSAISPILGTTIDYSLYTPRGHYTLNANLRRFFVAMSVLGQSSFCLPGTRGCPGIEPARMGILAASLIGYQLQPLWQQIYEPTSFLVGLSDDYTPPEVFDAVNKANGYVGLGNSLSDAVVEKIVRTLLATRRVRIDPERAAIRIMGTRFVADSFLLDQLIYPNVGTAAKPRLLPSGLDLAAAFGSKPAESALAATGATAYANYLGQLKTVQAAVAARAPGDWGGTVYDAWLAALQPMFVPHGKAFPDFMRTQAWASKDLQSGLGSYTELKHDTVLFAKQSSAEGGGPVPKVLPRDWVEPDPAAFGRLAAAADLLEQGLGQRNLLTTPAASLLSTEIDLFRFLERVAASELAGTSLAAADANRLRFIGGELEAIWWRTYLGEHGNVVQDQDAAAVVADIASSPNSVLELGTGQIDRFFVIVPGNDGTFEVASGGVYSYYEFTSPAGNRLTDQAWHAKLAADKAPPRPAWEKAFLLSSS